MRSYLERCCYRYGERSSSVSVTRMRHITCRTTDTVLPDAAHPWIGDASAVPSATALHQP